MLTAELPPLPTSQPLSTLPPKTDPQQSAPDCHQKSYAQEFLERGPDPEPAPFIPSDTYATTFRHGSWSHDRTRVAAAMLIAQDMPPARRSTFLLCGHDAYVEQRCTCPAAGAFEYRIRSTKCHDRFCVPCSRERSARIRDALLLHMYKRPNLSLLTLTLRHTDGPLAETLDRLNHAFRSLRGTPLWHGSIQGGVSIIETKVSATDGLWHCHIHAIIEHKFVRQSDLSRAWLKITKDSDRVHIRRVGSLAGASSYITKYVTKAADSSIIRNPTRLAEALTAFQRRRLVTTFGAWRGLKLSERPKDEEGQITPREAWTVVNELNAIAAAATAGDPGAALILRKLRRKPAPPADTNPDTDPLLWPTDEGTSTAPT